jgi:hypothetical protein
MSFTQFITLTNKHTDAPIRVNVNSIHSYQSSVHGETIVDAGNEILNVSEPAELIDIYLKESICTVKERHESTKPKTELQHSNSEISTEGLGGTNAEGDSDLRDSTASV